jgi:hypothetical protein
VCITASERKSDRGRGRENAKKAAMALLIHVSNCDGFAILSERFTSEELEELGQKFEESRKAGILLLEWADTIRK